MVHTVRATKASLPSSLRLDHRRQAWPTYASVRINLTLASPAVSGKQSTLKQCGL